MMPPPLTPSSPAPAAQHVGPSVYIPYSHHHSQQGRIPSFSNQAYMVSYARPNETTYAPMSIHLNASSAQYQTPYHLAPMPEQGSSDGPLISPPTTTTTHSISEALIKPKPMKSRPKKSPPIRISKPKISKSGKAKQRPQSSKHLTPSLRAAIITLKVTDPNKSFKEIGEILSLPADDEYDDVEENIATQSGNTQSATKNRNVADITHNDNLDVDGVTNSTTSDPNLESGSTDNTTVNPIPSIKPLKSKSKIKRKERKPIPRNTVAGIFKRAVDRAGTDSDLFKLLEQTGRRAGSGRPRKGTGKKDREQATSQEIPVTTIDETWQTDLDSTAVNGNGIDGASSLGLEIGLDDEDGGIDMDGLEMDGLDMDGDPDGQGGWDTDDGDTGGDGDGGGDEDGE